jgi:DNA-binding NarL/FixJ family response regulator
VEKPGGMTTRIELLVAELPVIADEGYAAWLGATGAFRVVVAGSDDAALLAQASNATLALIDLNTVQFDPAALIRAMKASNPALRVLVLSSSADRGQVAAVIKAGAEGYAMRFVSRDALIEALQKVAGGANHYDAGLAEAFVDPHAQDFEVIEPSRWQINSSFAGYVEEAAAENDSQPLGQHGLTRREREILLLVATGHNSASISTRLFISVPTVRKHRENLFRKLELHNIAEVTAYALRSGLLAAA